MPTFKVVLRGKSINILYSHGQLKHPIPTAIKVEPKYYGGVTGKWIKPSAHRADALNLTIQNRLNKLSDHVKQYFDRQGVYPPPKSLAGFFKRPDGDLVSSLWSSYVHFKTKGEDAVALNRLRKYNSTFTHLMAFDADVTVSQLNAAWLLEFVEYHKNLGNAQNTYTGYVKVLKSFIRWAVKMGYSNVDLEEIRSFKSTYTQLDIIFNTDEEIQLLLNANFAKIRNPVNREAFKRIRDVYLIECFSGLRFSDMQSRKWRITSGFIELQAVKTRERVIVPVRPELQYLLNKYPDGLPVFSNAYYNKAIKNMAQAAGITTPYTMVKGRRGFKSGQTYPKYQLLSSHVARATFICWLIKANVQTKKIMKMTGIKEEKTLRHYSEVLDETLAVDMAHLVKQQGFTITGAGA